MIRTGHGTRYQVLHVIYRMYDPVPGTWYNNVAAVDHHLTLAPISCCALLQQTSGPAMASLRTMAQRATPRAMEV